MEDFAELMMLGIRVREVRHLDEGAIFLLSFRLLIVDSCLTPDERRRLTDEYLPLAADSATAAGSAT